MCTICTHARSHAEDCTFTAPKPLPPQPLKHHPSHAQTHTNKLDGILPSPVPPGKVASCASGLVATCLRRAATSSPCSLYTAVSLLLTPTTCRDFDGSVRGQAHGIPHAREHHKRHEWFAHRQSCTPARLTFPPMSDKPCATQLPSLPKPCRKLDSTTHQQDAFIGKDCTSVDKWLAQVSY